MSREKLAAHVERRRRIEAHAVEEDAPEAGADDRSAEELIDARRQALQERRGH